MVVSVQVFRMDVYIKIIFNLNLRRKKAQKHSRLTIQYYKLDDVTHLREIKPVIRDIKTVKSLGNII